MSRVPVVLALITFACRTEPGKTTFGTVTDEETDETGDDTDEGDADADADSDTDTDTDADADSDADADLPEQAWTLGPALPACTAVQDDPMRVALSGVVLLTTGAVAGHVVIDRNTGIIECAGSACNLAGATVVCTEGIISPALIDSHDHTQYNVIAPWQHGELYDNRYDWQSDPDYFDYREAYEGIADTYDCEIVKWAELRQIVGGATSVVGSYGDACIDVLARNLDEDETNHGIPDYELYFSSGRVTSYDEADAEDRAAEIQTGETDVFLDHVAEGVAGTVTSEIDVMFELGMVGPGNAFVHATDATVAQLAAMASTSTGLVWSPRSNLDLYADTTRADLAARLGVPLSIGPDWTWSGSNRASAELDCAYDWLTARGSELTDVDMWEASTIDTAVLFGLQGQLGMLVAGAKADVSVFAYSEEPYRAIIESAYEDVWLVTIDGHARYGKPELVAGMELDPDWCEEVTACTETRTLCVAEADSGTDADRYSDLEAILTAGLAETVMPVGLEYAGELYPLWACDEVRASCDPREPTEDDTDGDGLDDGDDSCPVAYDPADADHDSDGLGDACDLCPLTAEAACTHNPDDIDDDGVENDDDGCPYLADDGTDGDADGHPDVCDPCPLDANPGDTGCPITIRSLRDPNDPAHPAEGTRVTVYGVVVTGVGEYGLFVQDPAESEYAALYVYGGSAAVGDLVDVTGAYVEYYGLTELEDVTVTVTGAGTVPTPLLVDPCDVGTGGPDAERYESMLLEIGATTVTNDNPDGPSDDYNEFEVGGCLRVDDQLCPTCWTDQPALGTAYDSLVGPMTYSYGDTKLLPRTLDDMSP
jgi:cytosine/adenosine deaminase-related metal-dependent hydrolase